MVEKAGDVVPPWLKSFKLDPRLRVLIVSVVIGAFTIQAFRVLESAYPVVSNGAVPGSNITIDFGAYYNAAWRLLHNPTQLYTNGVVGGDYPFKVQPVPFLYLPYFAYFILPYLTLSFTSGAVAWDAFQFLLLPAMGFLLFKALRNYNIIVMIGVLWIVLLQPLPFPPHYTVSFYDLYHSQSYYWQWAEGQAKVFETFFVVLGFYLSKARRPYLAGVAYGIAFFDPRFPLLAIPLYLIINRGQYRRFAIALFGTLAVGDLILLYDGLASSFITMVQTNGLGVPYYQYTWIPAYSIAALTAVEGFNLLYRAVRSRPAGPPAARDVSPPVAP
jgi:hypothetical protein